MMNMIRSGRRTVYLKESVRRWILSQGGHGLTPQESLQLTLQGTVDAEGNMYDFPPERFMEE